MLNFFPFSAPSAAAPHRIRHIRKGGRAVKSAADSLETETFTAEREWVVEGFPYSPPVARRSLSARKPG